MADAGTVTVAEERDATLRKITWTWTSSAGGAADLQTANAYTGALVRLVTIPSAGSAPTALYDITLLDEDGVDVLAGAGIDRSATLTEQVAATSLGCVANDKLYLHITNAGNAKAGTVIVFLR
jgi:hypothetical protein